MRKELPLVLTIVGAVIYMAATFVSPAAMPGLAGIKGELDAWFLIVFASAYAIGLANLTRIHFMKVNRRREGWQYSTILLAALAVMLILGLTTRSTGVYTRWMFLYLTVEPQATVFSLLVFYIGSAAFRAFRIRTFEAGVLLLAAVILMLGQAPIGAVISDQIPRLSAWILRVPNTAGMRGIQIAATLGATATALRIVFGIERTHLGGGE